MAAPEKSSFLRKQESRDARPQWSPWTLAFARVTRPTWSSSNFANARQHLLGEELERLHQAPGIGGAGVLKGEVEHADADLLAAALDLPDDCGGAAVERGRQHPADRRRARLARDIAGIEL